MGHVVRPNTNSWQPTPAPQPSTGCLHSTPPAPRPHPPPGIPRTLADKVLTLFLSDQSTTLLDIAELLNIPVRTIGVILKTDYAREIFDLITALDQQRARIVAGSLYTKALHATANLAEFAKSEETRRLAASCLLRLQPLRTFARQPHEPTSDPAAPHPRRTHPSPADPSDAAPRGQGPEPSIPERADTPSPADPTHPKPAAAHTDPAPATPPAAPRAVAPRAPAQPAAPAPNPATARTGPTSTAPSPITPRRPADLTPAAILRTIESALSQIDRHREPPAPPPPRRAIDTLTARMGAPPPARARDSPPKAA